MQGRDEDDDDDDDEEEEEGELQASIPSPEILTLPLSPVDSWVDNSKIPRSWISSLKLSSTSFTFLFKLKLYFPLRMLISL